MLKVEKLIPGGQALATKENGKKIFFWNALPDEYVEEYEVTKKKSHYEEAIATRISHPSSYRIEPRDDCYLSTSPWQIMDYDYELKQKQSLVVEIFREHQIDIDLPPIFTDYRDFFYRNKMEYSLYWDMETSTIKPAFRQRGSHRKIPIDKSSIERPEIFKKATEIIDELNARHEEARKYQSLLLRCNQNGEVSGGLYENHHPHPVFSNLTDTILGVEYSYSPNGFFQINLPVYELTLKEIKPYVTTDNVLDLYSGVGTIGLSVASDHHLTLVECDKPAFRELNNNITKTGQSASPVKTDASDSVPEEYRSESLTSNILGILSKSEDVTEYITPDQTVILDPPRAGCDDKLINKLLEVTPERIIYLSCNPATQVRDVKELLKKYHIDSVKTFNFFPRTPHIENLVILTRKS